MKKFLQSLFNKFQLNKSINNEGLEGNKNDISKERSNLNQPSSSVQKERDPNKFRKAMWITIIVIIGCSLIAGIVVSLLGTGPKMISDFDDIEFNGQDSYSLVKNEPNKPQKTIQKINSDYKPYFYYDGRIDNNMTRFKLSYGNNFTGFYIPAILYSKVSEQTENNNNTTPPNSGTTTNTTIKLETFVQIKNIHVNIANGSTYRENSAGQLILVPGNGATVLGKHLTNLLVKITNSPAGFDWSIILNFVPILLSIIFFVIIFRMMKGVGQGGGQESVFSIGKSQAKIAQSNIKFSDVAGIQEEKNELIELVDYLKRPEKYVAMGARVPKGVILYGPPGTGKTLLAKAVAGEAEVPFFQVSGSAFEDMLVGVGAKRVRDLFSKAVKASPAIIFIDEIDSVGSKRGKLETTSGSLADQTLNQLLAEMDGFTNRTGVIVMAATNRLDVLDDALLRPGRFDRHIQVNLPDIKERTEILKIHAKNKNLSSSVELEDIARRTPGFSGAQLENVLNEATLLAVRKNKNSINVEDLDEAIDRVIAGPAKKTKVISKEEKKQIAYHEAGHALVGLHSKNGDVVQKITIIPRGQAAGYTLSVPKIQELSIQKKSDLLDVVATTLGGRASEEFIYGKESVSTGASNDLYKVTNIVRAMVTQLGMTDVGMTQFVPSEGVINPYQQKLYSEQTSILIDKEIEKIIQKQYEKAMNIIKKNKKELDLIVESLLILETIVKPQIDYIHENLKLPEEALKKKKELEKREKETKKNKEEKKETENKSGKQN